MLQVKPEPGHPKLRVDNRLDTQYLNFKALLATFMIIEVGFYGGLGRLYRLVTALNFSNCSLETQIEVLKMNHM